MLRIKRRRRGIKRALRRECRLTWREQLSEVALFRGNRLYAAIEARKYHRARENGSIVGATHASASR